MSISRQFIPNFKTKQRHHRQRSGVPNFFFLSAPLDAIFTTPLLSPSLAKMTTAGLLRPAPYSPAVTLPAPYPQDTAFPISLRPTQPGPTVAELRVEIRTLSALGRIRDLLDRHGAIYFQGLGLKDANEFSQFAHAFGWKPHEDIGNPVRRTVLAPNVATANEGPNTMPVYPHNEFGLSPHYPAYVLFYCVKAAEEGQFPLFCCWLWRAGC